MNRSQFGRLNTKAAYAPVIGHPTVDSEWNVPNHIEQRLLDARRSLEEIKAWRKLVKAH
jgi:hypothetical protein